MESQPNLGQEWLQQLLIFMGLAAEVHTDDRAETAIADLNKWLNIDGSNLTPEQKQLLIGSKGESIDAIQYLANTILNLDQDLAEQNSFVVELDNYRARRNEELVRLTEEAIAKVEETGQEFEIVGLSSAERKQIHCLLESREDLATESRGQEPNRRLVVLPQ